MSIPDSGDLRGQESSAPAEDQVNPVAYWIQNCRTRTRATIPDDTVERRAMYLQSGNSFTPWGKLDDKEKELWRHLARVDLNG